MPDLCVVWKLGQLSLRYLALGSFYFILLSICLSPLRLRHGCSEITHRGVDEARVQAGQKETRLWQPPGKGCNREGWGQVGFDESIAAFPPRLPLGKMLVLH